MIVVMMVMAAMIVAVVVAAMIVAVVVAAVIVAAVIVGAVLGIERRFDRRKARAEPAQHVLDHVVAADAQAVADDLNVDVAIADVPGEPRQLAAVGRGDLDERLRPAGDAHDRAVVEHKAVAVAQRCGLRQIEQKFCAALTAQHHPPAMTLMRVERNRIDGAPLIPVSGGFDGARALHS